MSSLIEILDIKNGKIADFSGSKYPAYGGNGIIGYSDKYNFEDIIIIGRVGAYCGSVHFEKGKCWVSDNALAGVPKNQNSKFNYYLLKVLSLNAKQIGSSQPLLTQGILNNLQITFPTDTITQQQIAAVLSALDDKIELNFKINAELEATAKALYDYWCLQFDFPNESGKPYKSYGGKMVYNDELKRDIPEGWEVKCLREACKTSLGGTPSTKNKKYWQGTIPWLNSGEADFPIISTEQKITKEAIANSSTKLLPKGTVLLSITRHLRANILGIDACVNQSVVGITGSNKLKSSYLYLFIAREIPRLMTLRTGAQQPHINKDTVDDSLIIIPSEKTLVKFYSIAEPIFENIILNAKQNQTLASLRDWLLPMLMTGQVTVKEAYKMAEETLSMAAEPETGYKTIH